MASRVRLPGLVVLLALVAGGVVAVMSAGGHRADTLERIQEEGVVRVGFANEAPYAYIDSESGRLTGEAPEIARVVLERMGVERIDGVLTEFSSLIPGLQAGHFDLVAAGMYVTPERCRAVSFSEPTYCVAEAFLVPSDNPRDLHSYEDVAADPEARLGVVGGTVEVGYAEAVGVPGNRVVIFPDPPSAMEGLQAGRIDAYGGTSLTIQNLLDTRGSERLARAEPFLQPVIDGEVPSGCGAFAFRPEDVVFRQMFDRHLSELLGSEAHARLVRPFGFTERERPTAVSTRELCEP